MSYSGLIGKEDILEALHCLNGHLSSLDVAGTIKLFGGGALVLGFGARGATKDLDALFFPAPEIRACALRVATQRDWPEGWLNDSVKGFLMNLPPENTGKTLLTLSHLTVWVPPPQYLLAMKVYSCRMAHSHDPEDIIFLSKVLGVPTAEGVMAIAQTYYGTAIPPRAWYLLQEMEARGELGGPPVSPKTT